LHAIRDRSQDTDSSRREYVICPQVVSGALHSIGFADSTALHDERCNLLQAAVFRDAPLCVANAVLQTPDKNPNLDVDRSKHLANLDPNNNQTPGPEHGKSPPKHTLTFFFFSPRQRSLDRQSK
jgi:hypothetical protein